MKEKLFVEEKRPEACIVSAIVFVLCLAACGHAFAQSCADPIVVSPSSLPNGEVYVPYNATISATGGMGSYSFSVSSGSLPYGFSLDSYSGLLSGTPYSGGTYNFEVSAFDYYCYTTGSRNYTLTIEDPCSSLMIAPESLPDAYVGSYYHQSFSASGGTPPYSFFDSLPLEPSWGWPPGISMTSSGVVSGTPTEEGEWQVYVYVEDSSSPYPCSNGTEVLLTVRRQCPVIMLEPSDLPDAVLGEPYSQRITATGGYPPYAYSLTRGDLPPGLSFSSGGILAGTPEEPGKFTFYVSAVDANRCSGEMVYAVSVDCLTGNGTLSGRAGIRDEESGALCHLNGDGVTGIVTASGASGSVYTTDLVNGSYSFGTIPAGNYSLSAIINYTDHILYDAELLSYGCAAPSQKRIVKTLTIPPRTAAVKCDTHNAADLTLPPPMVMLHGIFDCYSKWYASDGSDADYYRHFDNYARSLGRISFTPNYNWWSGSWSLRVSEVLDQVSQDMSSLCASGMPPYILVTHDMGGLVARALGSGPHSGDPVVRKMEKAYLLGVPNSGADYNARLGRSSLLGPNSIIRYFNEVYPDFGALDVHAVAGTGGWWNTDNNDGVVSTGSVFSVRRIACLGEDCVIYPALTLDSGPGHLFNYDHWELGSPGSAEDIFGLLSGEGKIEARRPEAPVGGVGWGTVGHTSTAMTTNAGSLLARSEMSYPFTVSKCDGIAIVINLTQGSAEFSFVDPAGAESLIRDGLFVKAAPAPGNCSLKVLPGPSGVSFSAVVIDNSIFGISGYLTSQNLLPGETTIVRVDKKGDWSLVTPQSVQAFLYDKNGTLLRTVALDEKGGFFSGLLSAPDAQGSYEVFIQATGTFNGAGFTRVEFETMNVLGTSRLFTGAFADFPSDSDGDGKYDSIVFSCSAALPSAGYHTVAADLYDSRGNFVSHSSASLEADSQGTKSFDLPFDLGGVHCGQFSGKFMVSGLKILDGDDLRPLDVWNEEISTGLYQAGTFDCSSAPLSPVISNIAPSKVTVGTAVNIAITGKNFDEGATLVFDQSISVVGSQRYDNRVFFATISVSGSSAPGFRDVKIINPDGRSGILKDVLLVAADTPPMVSFESPSDGSVVSGTVNVTANAVDDVKIESVSFALDGAHQATVSAFPFIWSWNSGASGLGTHVVSATAVDSSGKETSAQSVVSVVRAPVITSVSKKGDPFRFVVSGANLQPGVSVYINGDPWTNVRWKNSGRIVIKGGPALKAKVPKGMPVTLNIVNPDGGSQSTVWKW